MGKQRVTRGAALVGTLAIDGGTDAPKPVRLVGGTASGAPATGTNWKVGDVAVDITGALNVCTVASNADAGTWVTAGNLTGEVSLTSVTASGGVVAKTAAFTPTKTVTSATSAKWDGVSVPATTVTLTGTAAVTTATGFNLATLAAPTVTDASACTVSYAATLAITGAPIAAGSATLTNAYALWVQGGNTKLSGTATLDAPVVLTPQVVSALAVDVTKGGVATKTIADDATFTAAATGTAGQLLILEITASVKQCVATFSTRLNSSGTMTIPQDKIGCIMFVSDGTSFREVGRSINL